MKKGLKYTLVSLGSLVVLTGVGLGDNVCGIAI